MSRAPLRLADLSIGHNLNVVAAKDFPSLHIHFSGAAGNLSITYFPLATLTMGTPGIFRNLLLRSRSFVATKYTLCFITLSTMQLSAYVPL